MVQPGPIASLVLVCSLPRASTQQTIHKPAWQYAWLESDQLCACALPNRGSCAARITAWLAQPPSLTEIQHWDDGRACHQDQGHGVAKLPLRFWHESKVHAVQAGNQRGRQQRNAGHREDFYNFVLVDVDEANGGVHQKVDFVEQERGV
jgi:hypothetical protein